MSFEMHQFLLFIWQFPTLNSPQSTLIIGSPPAATPLYLYLPFCGVSYQTWEKNLLKQPFKNRPRTTVRGLEGNLEYGTP